MILKWKKISPGIYHATSPWGLYTIDGNNADRNRWTVTYPSGDYGMVDSLAEAKAWAMQDAEERSTRPQNRSHATAALGAPRVANRAKLEALLQFHADTAAMWRADAEEWKKSTHPEAADELRHAQEFGKEHDQLAKKIVKASVKSPDKLVELSRLGDTPERLHMSEEDVWGPDEEE